MSTTARSRSSTRSRSSEGGVDDAAEYLGVRPELVRAAVDYYREFSEQVDEDARVAAEAEHRSRLDAAAKRVDAAHADSSERLGE